MVMEQVHAFECTLVRGANSGLAELVEYEGSQHWLARSNIVNIEEVDEHSYGEKVEILLPRWLAIREGFMEG